jgi:penicillin-binding protein 1A
MPDAKRRRQTRLGLTAEAPAGPTLTGVKPRDSLAGSPRRNGRGPVRPRLKKLRLAAILAVFLILALISTVFGMMMAVAQDLPSLDTTNEFKQSSNSVLVDARGRKLAVLTGSENRILVPSDEISPNMKHATVAIEDARFYTHKGVDYRGIARALWADVRRQQAAQGGSTITQQFIKNALAAQKHRSLFQKLREAALAYQLERKWPKDRILTQYLNTVYFGEGAYGVESAARVYFGWSHPGCEPNCAAVLQPAEAALLAGMIASPASYSPQQNPASALERRNLVLEKMRDQNMLPPSEYAEGVKQALPPRNKIQPPHKISRSPYFSSWVEQQLVDRYGTGATFGGGLRIRTGLDLDLQNAAEQAIASHLAGVGPSAALVALDNKTGAVRAMVGGPDFDKQPFNLATQGHRQPGSAFKPFTLVAALEKGISPGQTFASQMKKIPGPQGVFTVHNYNDRYSGVISLASATTVSDNSVYAEVGYKLVGTRAVARAAEQMGIRTHLSRNPAMVLGGLQKGVTPLEMADAYLTLAHGGSRISGSLAAYDGGPVGFTKVEGAGIHGENHSRANRVVPAPVAAQVTQILQTVISTGTGKSAQTGDFAAGKTGTTENYQDAWFVGWDHDITVAVWVGYPQGAKPMETEYRGQPVAGGTFPAEIWRDFILSADKIRAARAEKSHPGSAPAGPAPVLAPPSVTPPPTEQPAKSKRAGKRKAETKAPPENPARPPAPTGSPAPTPAPTTPTPQPAAPGEPAPQPAPSNGGAGAGGTEAGGTGKP